MLKDKCIEIARDIYRELGNEQQEVTYKNAFEVAFRLDGIKYEREKYLPIYYRNQIIGYGNADYIVRGDIVLALEIKAIASWNESPPPDYVSQTKNYMKSENTEQGILINFPQACKKGESVNIEIYDIGGTINPVVL